MKKKDKKVLAILTLLILSISINLFLLVDYTPQPKKVLNLKFNKDYSYTLASTEGDDSKSILIQYDEDCRAKEYITFDKSYQQVIMTNSGVLLINGKKGELLKNDHGNLKNEVVNIDVPENIVTNGLTMRVGNGLQLIKEIDIRNLNNEQQRALNVIDSDINIFQNYSMEYKKAFLVNDENYIPKDFDSLSLH